MMESIIGRRNELLILDNCVESGRAEFVAIYGRRRIGKTFLVRSYFNDQFDFYMTGVFEAPTKEHLRNFAEQLSSHSMINRPVPSSWHEAFLQLKEYLSTLKKPNVIVFIDELPWLDRPRSGFRRELDYFWNSWGAFQSNLKLIVCGSAATWMVDKLIGDKGGLHNRLTRSIRLLPFSLGECEQFLQSREIYWDRYAIAECYMILGGVPYYLNLLRSELSLAQNIDYLFFSESGPLRREYGFVFRSIFGQATVYHRIVELLSNKMRGMTREEIQRALKLDKGGLLSTALSNLRNCDFIRRYNAFGKKERGALYQLSDNFTLFYLRFADNGDGVDENAWSKMIDDSRVKAWKGYAFELLCLLHINKIKEALGISGILTTACSWIGSDGETKGQIDLVIDRKDRMINLCEMKFSTGLFTITKAYNEHLLSRRELFRESTSTTKTLALTMVTTYGIKKTPHSNTIQQSVVLDQLF